MKKSQKPKILKILSEEAGEGGVQQLPTSFDKLLQNCYEGTDQSKRSSLKLASKHEGSTTDEGRLLLVDTALTLLGCADKVLQREAAVVLSSHDLGRESQEWDQILFKSMVAFSKLTDDEYATPLFKSLRHLISKAVLANPEGAAAAVVMFCGTELGKRELPNHMTKELERWASKYTQEGNALRWHQILRSLGLPDMPKIEQIGDESAASIDFRGSTKQRRPSDNFEAELQWHASKMEIERDSNQTRYQQQRSDVVGHCHEESARSQHQIETRGAVSG
jgi:hypothetical protein